MTTTLRSDLLGPYYRASAVELTYHPLPIAPYTVLYFYYAINTLIATTFNPTEMTEAVVGCGAL